MVRNQSAWLLALTCTALLQACYEEEEVAVEVMQLTPAQVDLSHQRVAVLPFAGLGGDVLADRMRDHLVDRGIGVAAKVTQDSEALETYHAVEDIALWARALEADAVLEGGTTDIDVLEEITPDYDPHTRLTTYERHIKLVLKGQAQLRDAQGGTLHRMRFDASHAPQVMGSVQVNGRPPHNDTLVEELLEPFNALAYLHQQLEGFVDVLRGETQPVYHRAAWILFQSSSLPDSLRAVDQARAMHWHKAADIYERALPRVRGNEARARVHYNLGVAQVMQGMHDQAAHSLRTASTLTRKQRVQQLCHEALADNEMILRARHQVTTLGWSLEN